jgi:uncharacterized membrane protein HdeD (DUF308 family)
MFEALIGKWWVLALRGILGIVFGIVALVYPGITLDVLVIFLGAYAVVDGVFALFTAIGGDGKDRLWYVLEGIIGIGLGILVFAYPGISERALIYVIAAWAILTGVLEIIAGFELPISREWLLALAGLASVVFGVLVFFNPGAGALAIVWMIGIYALVFGVVLLVLAFRLRGLGEKQTSRRTA